VLEVLFPGAKREAIEVIVSEHVHMWWEAFGGRWRPGRSGRLGPADYAVGPCRREQRGATLRAPKGGAREEMTSTLTLHSPGHERVLLGHNWKRRAQAALLACGIAAPVIYLASDVLAGVRWGGYSFRDQTISELNAFGSPSRPLTIVLGLAGYTLLTAFGVWVWRSAAEKRSLRVAGGALAVLGITSLWAVPFWSMHVRGAETSFTDTMQYAGGAIAGVLLFAAIGFAAAAFGNRYRLYSVATILVMVAFLVWTGMDGSRVADNLATPWLGVKERIWVYTYQLWIVVFAITLLRRHRAQK
jgi:hypothetical protein